SWYRALRALLVLAQASDSRAEIGFDAVGLLQTVLEQQLHERPVLGAPSRGEVRRETGAELLVRGERGHIEQLLDARHGALVKGRDAAREDVDRVFDLRVWNEPVHIAILRRERRRYVVATEQDLHRSAAPDQTAQTRHRTSTRHGADTDLELT